MMRRKLACATFILLSSVLSGCAAHGAYYGRYSAPPPPRYGVLGVAPGPGYVWTEGYWDQRGSNWIWVGGRWMHPPRPRAVWVAPRWSQEGRGWRFHQGYWR
jgi:hypothetical protein